MLKVRLLEHYFFKKESGHLILNASIKIYRTTNLKLSEVVSSDIVTKLL
jgi:hypothetical protein